MQDCFNIVYNETYLIIKSIVFQILKILNIKQNTKNFDEFLPKFRSIFQDNFSLIFLFEDVFYEKIVSEIKLQIEKYINFEIKNEFLNDIKCKSFRKLIHNFYELCIYMILHDPIISLNIEKYENREMNYYFYNKNQHINIEGFGKNDPCLIILNPPQINSRFPYQGIKPAVYIIKNYDNIIKEKCELNQMILKSNSIDFNVNDRQTISLDRCSELNCQTEDNLSSNKQSMFKFNTFKLNIMDSVTSNRYDDHKDNTTRDNQRTTILDKIENFEDNKEQSKYMNSNQPYTKSVNIKESNFLNLENQLKIESKFYFFNFSCIEWKS